MLKSAKTRALAARLKVERLEDRLQPSVGFGVEDGLFGHDLFDRDPLTGRPIDLTNNNNLMAPPPSSTQANSSVQTSSQQVQVVQNNQLPTTNNQAQLNAQQLILAASTTTASQKLKNIDFASPVSSPSTPVVSRDVTIQQEMPLSPVTLQVNQHVVGDGAGITEGFDFGTGYNGVAGNDQGNAVGFFWTDPAFSRGVAFYAGFTSRNGNRDMMVWAIDHFQGFGTTRLWEVVISAQGNVGADEALGIDVSPDGSEVFVAGYTTTTVANGEDLTILRLNANTGAIINSVAIGGPGNSRANDVRAFPFLAPAFIAVTGQVPSGANTLFYNGLLDNTLNAAYSNAYGFTNITFQRGDAVALNYAGESMIAGNFTDGGDKGFFAKIDAAGDAQFAGTSAAVGEKFGGIDIEILGTNLFWVTGEVNQTSPNVHKRMFIGSFNDNGTAFTQNWGFLWTYNFGPPGLGSLAGNYVRAGDYDGSTYVICELWGPTENRDTGDNDAHIFKVSPDGASRPDFYHYGLDTNAALGNDRGYGLAYTGSVGVVATGKAQYRPTPDGFPVSAGMYQTTHGDTPNQNLDDAWWGWNFLPGA